MPRLLEDGPASRDEFGSHERIARGMASLIQNQDGGHVIGLRGPFGSGKSTTVAELERQLPSKEWSVVTFDAWTHRGHDLMRAFLASTIKQLANAIGTDKAEKTRKEIIDETETKTTQTQSTVNGWGQALVAIGIIATVVMAGLRATNDFGHDAFGIAVTPTTLLWIGWAPWILLMLVFLVGFVGPWPAPAGVHGTGDRWIVSMLERMRLPNAVVKYARSGGLGIQFIQEGERIQTVTTSSTAANSITFQDKFAEVVELAVGATNRKLVIVLDNMDRLEEGEQLSAWATVQAFVDAKFPLKSRVWFVVPLSYIEVKGHRGESGKPVENEADANSDAEIRVARLRENLADKIFLTEFRVPEVVLTDWVAYQNSLCDTVLSHADEDERSAAARVVVSWMRSIGTRPRPRQLRAIVNQIGGLCHQWRDEVPLAVIAIYVVKVQDLESRGEALSDEEIIADFASVPGRRVIQKESISQDLAMLHFSAPREKALQVLVHSSFSDAMMAGKALSDDGLSIPNVGTLIDHVARDVLTDAKPGSTILRIAACLDDASGRGAAVLGYTWAFLVGQFASSEEAWEISGDGILEAGLVSLAARAHDRGMFEAALAGQIGKTLMESLSDSAQEEENVE